LVSALAATSDPVMIELDATSESEVAALANTISERFSTLDVLVNNVGGLVKRATLAELDLQLGREVMAVNLDNTYLVTRALLPLITPRRGA
jgi:3-oxoacyl-[acyl-carrier protein] reductase